MYPISAVVTSFLPNVTDCSRMRLNILFEVKILQVMIDFDGSAEYGLHSATGRLICRSGCAVQPLLTLKVFLAAYSSLEQCEDSRTTYALRLIILPFERG